MLSVNSKLGNALLLYSETETSMLMSKFYGWRRMDIAEEDPQHVSSYVKKGEKQKVWNRSINGVKIVMNKVLKFYEGKRNELNRISKNNKEEYLKEVKSIPFFNFLLDEEDLERLYSGECDQVRRMERFDIFIKEAPPAAEEPQEAVPDLKSLEPEGFEHEPVEPLGLEQEDEEDEEEAGLDENIASDFSRWLELRKFALESKQL